MRSVGIPRRVDELGRIVVPVEFRRLLGIRDGDELEIAMEGDRLVLAKVEPACVFCGARDALRPFHERSVCEACLAELTGT